MKQRIEIELAAADALIARRTAGQTIACARGCSWCCHQLIVVTNRDDGIAMLQTARNRLSEAEYRDVVSNLREQVTRIGNMSHEDAESRRWTCPFLRGGECSIYDVRPIACRAVISPDASCCKAMMQADDFEDLSANHQALATDIGERAMALQIDINDRREITGAIEMRTLLVSLL